MRPSPLSATGCVCPTMSTQGVPLPPPALAPVASHVWRQLTATHSIGPSTSPVNIQPDVPRFIRDSYRNRCCSKGSAGPAGTRYPVRIVDHFHTILRIPLSATATQVIDPSTSYGRSRWTGSIGSSTRAHRHVTREGTYASAVPTCRDSRSWDYGHRAYARLGVRRSLRLGI